jgi:hypothetical protein
MARRLRAIGVSISSNCPRCDEQAFGAIKRLGRPHPSRKLTLGAGSGRLTARIQVPRYLPVIPGAKKLWISWILQLWNGLHLRLQFVSRDADRGPMLAKSCGQ